MPSNERATRLVLVGTAWLAAAACSETTTSTGIGPEEISVGLVNDAAEAVHIMLSGESFGPSNRIAPGMSLTRTFVVEFGEDLKFQAGRNQQVLAQIECAGPRDVGKTSGGQLVVYAEESGAGGLACVNWR